LAAETTSLISCGVRELCRSGAVEGIPGPLVGAITYRLGSSFYPCWAEEEPALELIHLHLFHRVKARRVDLGRGLQGEA